MDILSSGDTVSELFLLLSGAVEVVSPDPAATTQPSARVAPQGDSLAQASLGDLLLMSDAQGSPFQPCDASCYASASGRHARRDEGGCLPAFLQPRTAAHRVHPILPQAAPDYQSDLDAAPALGGVVGNSGSAAAAAAAGEPSLNPHSPISADLSGQRRPVGEGSVLGEAAFFTEVPQLEAVRSLTGGCACTRCHASASR